MLLDLQALNVLMISYKKQHLCLGEKNLALGKIIAEDRR